MTSGRAAVYSLIIEGSWGELVKLPIAAEIARTAISARDRPADRANRRLASMAEEEQGSSRPVLLLPEVQMAPGAFDKRRRKCSPGPQAIECRTCLTLDPLWVRVYLSISL